MLNIGFSEAVIIFLVALIVLGPEKLPEVGKFLAKLSLELKKGLEEVKKELELDEIEEDFKEAKEEIEKFTQEVNPLKETENEQRSSK